MKNKYFYLINPFRTYNKAKKYFKPLKAKFIFCKTYNVPMLYWNSNYIIWSSDVQWKDKYNTPRFEDHPCLLINLFGYTLGWIFKPKEFANDISDINNYWEQLLWYLYYYNNISYGNLDKPDIEKAKENWPWSDYNTNESTWDDKFLR